MALAALGVPFLTPKHVRTEQIGCQGKGGTRLKQGDGCSIYISPLSMPQAIWSFLDGRTADLG
jgi:hypothetical protein